MIRTVLAVAVAGVLAAPAAAEQPARPDLKAIMGELGAVHVKLSDALMRGDAEAVARAAEAIAHHPLPKPLIGEIKAALGDDFARFRAYDRATHVAAEGARALAAEGILDGAADQAGAMARGCVGCHTEFRERLKPLSPR